MSTNERRPKAKKLAVPDIDDDPAERKRILNVLAQRRYRRRKKEHVQRLERLTEKEVLQSAEPDFVQNIDHIDLTSTQMPYFDPFSEQCPQDLYTGVPEFPIVESALPEESLGFDAASLAAFEASLNFPLPSLPTSPSLTTMTNTSRNTANSSPKCPSIDLDQSLSFPDEVHLPILELNLLRGAMSIAQRLGVDSMIWSLEASSPFHNSASLAYTHLPINLRPTIVQLSNPHHPVLDILPWPSVRDKLILVFSQPENHRPPSARSPTALVELIYDVEDSAEGVRIWGDDPYSDQNWEVGEKLFKNWWWALDSHVLRRSNQLRRDRGAALLGASRQVQEID